MFTQNGYNVGERTAMKTFGLKTLLPMLIPVLLTLSAATPRLTPQSLFGSLSEGQPVLIYTLVWVPLLEASMMIAQRILPAKDAASSQPGQNTTPTDQQPVHTADHALNTLSSREPLILKLLKLDTTSLSLALAAPAVSLPKPYSPQSSQGPGILLLLSLVFLFKPLLPRSDVPR